MKKKQIRPNSYESYLNTYEVHVKPYFEKKKLKLGDVTARVVMLLFSYLLEVRN